MRYRSHFYNILFIVPAAAILAACGEDAAGPNGSGQISAAITDDPTATVLHQAGHGMSFAVSGQTAAAQFTGTVSGDAAVEISADGETWVELGQPQAFTLDAQISGTAATVHTEADVPVGAYVRARLVLEDAVASISAGSTIGGVVLNADVDLTLGGNDQTVTVEVPLNSMSVSADATTMLRFDLNAESWVTGSAVQAGTVSDAEVTAAVTAAAEVQSQ